MMVHGQDEDELTYAQIFINSSDLPATRKLIGLRSHSSKKFMCIWCHQDLDSLTHEDCFKRECEFSIMTQYNYIILIDAVYKRSNCAKIPITSNISSWLDMRIKRTKRRLQRRRELAGLLLTL